MTQNEECILATDSGYKRSAYAFKVNYRLGKCDTINDFSDSVSLNFYFNDGFDGDSIRVMLDGKCAFQILADDSLFDVERLHVPFAHIEKISIGKNSVISLQMNRGAAIDLKASDLSITLKEVNWIDINFKNDTLFLIRECGSIQ